jgi:vacuolar-type H+-ATPase subunit E/Vma4
VSETSATQAALVPVREFLLAQARAEAERTRSEAAAEAAAVLARARDQAAAILAEARARGESDGAAVAAAELARARRQARGLPLAARRQAYEALRQRARAAVRKLHEDPGYPRLRRRLARLAREQAGPHAVVSEPPEGGVVAEAPGRRVDCSLEELASRAVDALGAEVEGLWAP